MFYKGYEGSVDYSDKDGVVYGKIKSIKSLISYEAQTMEQLEEEFQNAVDDYLRTCEENNITPEEPNY